MPRESIVFIGAHPDDIGVTAGTLLLLKERYQLYEICLTRGQRGYQSPLEPSQRPPRADVAARRSAEEEAVCRLLGATLIWGEQMDAELFAGRDICQWVAAELARLRPAAVIALWPLQKPDHAAASQIARHALHLAGLAWTTELLMPFNLRENYDMQKPDLYVNISSVIEAKRALLECYQSQWSSETVAQILETNRIIGRMAWCDYAEAFISGLAPIAARWNRSAVSILMQL